MATPVGVCTPVSVVEYAGPGTYRLGDDSGSYQGVAGMTLGVEQCSPAFGLVTIEEICDGYAHGQLGL